MIAKQPKKSNPYDGRPYAVGKGKPPKEHRFAKGRSGNPKGRPKKQFDQNAEFALIFHERVTIRNDNKRKTVSAIAAALALLRNKALQGDMRALKEYVAIAERLGHIRAPEMEVPDVLPAEDAAILEAYRAYLSKPSDQSDANSDQPYDKQNDEDEET